MKVRRLTCITPLLLATAYVFAAPFPDKIDISGLELGASADTAAKIIQQELPKSRLRYIDMPTSAGANQKIGVYARAGDTRVTRALSNYDMGPGDEFVALYGDDGRVWFVSRFVRMNQGERISYDELVEAIKRKFGPPTIVFPHFRFPNTGPGTQTSMQWELLRNDREPSRPDYRVASDCDASVVPFSTNKLRGSNVVPDEPGPLNMPLSFNPKCSKLVTFTAGRDPDGMSSFYRLQLVDVAHQFDVQAEKAAAETRRKAKALEAEQAKGVQPKF